MVLVKNAYGQTAEILGTPEDIAGWKKAGFEVVSSSKPTEQIKPVIPPCSKISVDTLEQKKTLRELLGDTKKPSRILEVLAKNGITEIEHLRGKTVEELAELPLISKEVAQKLCKS